MKELFPILQRLGKAQVVPLCILPITAIIIFVNYIINIYVPEFSSPIYIKAANEALSLIPLLVAVGITLEFTKNDTIAVVCSILNFFILNQVIELSLEPGMSHPGIISGILIGAYTSLIYFFFHNLELPPFLGFFAGKRSVPIIGGLFLIPLGLLFSYEWPMLLVFINDFTDNVIYKHPEITFGVYGFVERLLIPLGLHHIWNTPFMIGFGEYTNSIGQVSHGELARFLAGDPNAGHMAGGYMFKMFGLPGAAIAIWRSSHKDARKKVGIAMGIAAITAFVSGITEPVEFTFMLTSPLLYGIHAVLAGSGYVVMELLGVRYSTSFSQGLFDFIALYPLSSKAYLIPIVGTAYFVIYFVVFRVIISVFDLDTPGRKVTKTKSVDLLSQENINPSFRS